MDEQESGWLHLDRCLSIKYFLYPQIIDLLLDMGTWGMGTPIEIEFAVNLSVPEASQKNSDFYK